MYTKPHSMLAQSGFGAVMAASSSSGVFIVGKQIVNFKQEFKIKTKNKKKKKKRPQVIEDVVVQATQRRESFS